MTNIQQTFSLYNFICLILSTSKDKVSKKIIKIKTKTKIIKIEKCYSYWK